MSGIKNSQVYSIKLPQQMEMQGLSGKVLST